MGGDDFVTRQEGLDNLIYKCGTTHHHFVTDVFVSDPVSPGGPSGIMTDYFTPDRVHLAERGIRMHEKILQRINDE